MKKKGFTLVELLAVIAILAILVIIALPNVLSMYRQARQNSFENEVKEVFRTAQQQFLIDSMTPTTSGTSKIYANVGSNPKKLDLQGGGTNFKYCIKLNEEGAVTQLIVSNGTYIYTNKDSELKLTDAQSIVFDDSHLATAATAVGFDTDHSCS
ncbi:MAG: prepilin-type N-terminal cleavage/methylation domain-containing protein [Bacilli bacterium]|nr:prepilin-type N-terminal cleavage/methylation domain-containing protein [Bacilli bacterium]